MAYNPQLASNTVASILDAICALMNSGFIEVFNGVQPANANIGVSTQVELVSFALGDPAFGTPSGGVAAANSVTPGTAIATGTASWFRIFASDGTTVIMDGSVGTVGCDLNLATVSINTGDLVGVTGFTISMPST